MCPTPSNVYQIPTRYFPLPTHRGDRRTSLGASEGSIAWVEREDAQGLRSLDMVLIYLQVVLSVFAYAITIPSSAAYAEEILGDARLSGLLIATYSYGTAAAQPVQSLLVRACGTPRTYVLTCVLLCVGGVAYAVAGERRSAGLLFGARAVCGSCSGTQLFWAAVNRMVRVEASRRTAVRVLALSQALGYVLALFAAAWIETRGAKTAPRLAGLVAAGASASVGAIALALLRTPSPSRDHVGSHARSVEMVPFVPSLEGATTVVPSPCYVLFHLLTIVLLTSTGGTRQIVTFELTRSRWRWSSARASSYAALIVAGQAATLVCESSAPASVWRPVGVSAFVVAALGLGVYVHLHWDTPAVSGEVVDEEGPLEDRAAAFSFAVLSVVLGPNLRESVAAQGGAVLERISESSCPSSLIVTLAVANALGTGLGATLATSFASASTPLLVHAIALALVAWHLRGREVSLRRWSTWAQRR